MAEASRTNPQGVERLGYLGLGLMGTPMTRRLLETGHQVTVWNRSEGKVGRARRGRRQMRSHPTRLVGELGHRLHVRDRCRRR
ncbi:3-hydroxyisobutyrate dehydrogenase-like beta-hydroxyacid dehydrogenase [Bradyrhizobium sp. LB1.3]